MLHVRFACLLLVLGLCPTGCAVGDGSPNSAIDAQMLTTASNYRAWPRINRAAYRSTLGAFNINLYVSQGADAFRRIHPETSASHVVLPVGTIIVREVLDAQGAPTKLTLMAKGPAGYDGRIGDWWFGVTDPHGVPLWDQGHEQIGALAECHSCHIPRATDDFLFGVPAADE